jgi:uncharacterized protein (DUF1501 family)
MAKGSGMTRREFIKKGLTFVAVTGTAPSLVSKTALAMPGTTSSKLAGPGASKNDRVLVVVQMGGGNDGLNTVIPYNDEHYYRLRPTLAVPRDQVLRLNREVGLHPSLAGFKELYDRGHMAIVLGVGYPDPDRSHLRAMEVWHTGDTAESARPSGWIGRVLDRRNAGANEPLALNLGDHMPLALQGERAAGVAFASPDQFRWLGTKEQRALYAAQNSSPASDGADPLDLVRHMTTSERFPNDKILAASEKFHPTAAYPKDSQFASGLKLVAQLVASDAPMRVYFAHLGGFDTHAAQKGAHARALEELSCGVAAFYRDLERQGNAGRVLTLAYSEFGRRVRENAEGGTDHGTAGPVFIVGGAVNPGVHGRQPTLTDLDQGDLRHSVDFRSIYATTIARWLGSDPAAVLGREFDPVPFLG